MNQERRLEIFRVMEVAREASYCRKAGDNRTASRFAEGARSGACRKQSEARERVGRDKNQDTMNSTGLSASINLCLTANSK